VIVCTVHALCKGICFDSYKKVFKFNVTNGFDSADLVVRDVKKHRGSEHLLKTGTI
jgi:hypothetical protein